MQCGAALVVRSIPSQVRSSETVNDQRMSSCLGFHRATPSTLDLVV